VLDDGGLLAEAWLPAGHSSGIPIDYADRPTRCPYQLGVEQGTWQPRSKRGCARRFCAARPSPTVERDGEGVTVTAG
jgi:hypothetical protein